MVTISAPVGPVPTTIEPAARRPGARQASGPAFSAAMPASVDVAPSRGSKSGELPPLQRFESFVLRSFVESMLPKDDTSFFGEGTAGDIWRSMLAERIGDEMAKGGGVGIAKLLADSPDGNKAAGANDVQKLALDAAQLSAVRD